MVELTGKMLNFFPPRKISLMEGVFPIPVLLILPQTEGDTAYYETPDSEFSPGHLKFMPYPGQTVDFQVVSLTVSERFLNMKFHSV